MDQQEDHASPALFHGRNSDRIKLSQISAREAVLDDDMIFMQEVLKPTEEDFRFLLRKKQQAQIVSVGLWACGLEQISFVQDVTKPPTYFVITSDATQILRKSTGGVVKAAPGTIWQQIALEEVPGEPQCFWVGCLNSCPVVSLRPAAWHRGTFRERRHTSGGVVVVFG